jgi:hypothetical protein
MELSPPTWQASSGTWTAEKMNRSEGLRWNSVTFHYIMQSVSCPGLDADGELWLEDRRTGSSHLPLFTRTLCWFLHKESQDPYDFAGSNLALHFLAASLFYSMACTLDSESCLLNCGLISSGFLSPNEDVILIVTLLEISKRNSKTSVWDIYSLTFTKNECECKIPWVNFWRWWKCATILGSYYMIIYTRWDSANCILK